MTISETIEIIQKDNTRYLAIIENKDTLIGILRDIDILKAFKCVI
jgi:predicted transcriptional regulator